MRRAWTQSAQSPGGAGDAAFFAGALTVQHNSSYDRKTLPECHPALSPSMTTLNFLDIRLPFAQNCAMAITRRQRQVYDFISEFVQSNGYSPSFEEIGEGLGLSSLATVHKHISNLEEKGLLKRDYNRSRSIDILPLKPRAKNFPPPVASLPLVGRIAAGKPIEQVETPESISLADFTRSKDVF